MASVLKYDSLQPGKKSTAEPVTFNVQDIQSRARDYLTEVQQQAAAILEQAHREAVTVKAQAHQSGLQAAREEIEKRIEDSAARISDNRCKTAIAACQQSVDQLQQATGQWLTLWRDQTIEIACCIAEKLVRAQMSSDNELLRVWMEEALVAMRDEREIRILVHPDDFSLAGRFLQSLAQTIPHAGSAVVLPDPEVQRGGCIVRSKNGRIDQQLNSQLQRLAEQLGSNHSIQNESL